MAKTCKTCKWFEQRERASVFDCSAVGTLPTVLVGHCNQDDAKWCVNDPPPDFGCIHHEPREPEQEQHR